MEQWQEISHHDSAKNGYTNRACVVGSTWNLRNFKGVFKHQQMIFKEYFLGIATTKSKPLP